MTDGTTLPVQVRSQEGLLAAPRARRPLHGVVTFVRRNRSVAIGAVIAIALALIAILAPWLALSGADDQNLRARLLPPFWAMKGSLEHPLGTDQLGRDIFSRIVLGSRISLGLATSTIVIAAIVGVALGLCAGYYGGAVDAAIMRLTDIQLSLPYLLFAIGILAILGPSLTNLMIVMVLNSWATYARLIRVSTLALREREFVLAARSLGSPSGRILLRHILPNVAAPAIIVTSFCFANLIILEASLSFLGLGVQPPLPSWGGMLGEGREYFTTAWWLTTFPGLAIILAALGANILGDSVRDLLDPQLRKM